MNSVLSLLVMDIEEARLHVALVRPILSPSVFGKLKERRVGARGPMFVKKGDIADEGLRLGVLGVMSDLAVLARAGVTGKGERCIGLSQRFL